MTGVPSINLYLDEKTKKQLKTIAEKENRSPSKQVKHMMEFYIQFNQKDLDDLIGSGWYPSPKEKKSK